MMILWCSSLLCFGCSKSQKQVKDESTIASEQDASTVTDATSVDDPTTAEQVDTEDATTVASNKDDEDTTEGTASGQSTTENRRDDDSDSPSKPTSTTEAPSAPSDPQPTEPDKPSHSHNWEPVYATRMVQQYADDGTTNDYSKPITEEKPVYEESPVYETHAFNNGVDVTVAVRNYNAEHGTNYIYADLETVDDLFYYLRNLGATGSRVYSQQVQVGTERVQVGTETVTVGYEQLGKKEEKYISGYRCSCGATK